jgi:hypothetical protein
MEEFNGEKGRVLQFTRKNTENKNQAELVRLVNERAEALRNAGNDITYEDRGKLEVLDEQIKALEIKMGRIDAPKETPPEPKINYEEPKPNTYLEELRKRG